MQLDFTQLRTKFEMTTSVRPMPHSEYVEMYIKAYYISQSSFEEWLEKHKVIIEYFFSSAQTLNRLPIF